MKKVEINHRLYSVTTMSDYTENRNLYNPKFTAIEDPDNGVVLPIKSLKATDNEPGILYQDGAMVSYVVKPNNPEDYSTDKIIDYSNPKNIGEIMEKNQLIKDIQQEIMATPDNIFQLNISDEDTPEMKTLKMAINSKGVDKSQYEDRFPQYQNDMRLLRGKSITLSKLISICSAFDISAELTLRDKGIDIPNPMGTEFTVDLTDRGGTQ